MNIEDITISRPKLTDIVKVKELYESSSDALKETMLGAWPLTSNIGLLHLILSITPLRFFLLFEIKPVIAKKEGEILGFGYIIKKKHKHENVLGIFVHEDFQGRGIGDRLLSTLLEGVDEVILNVASTNTNAIRLYQKKGFQNEGTIQTMRFKRKK